MTNTYGPIFENYVRSGRHDSKGREIGYIVGLRDNGAEFAAWVQNARRINGAWVEFGVPQRSRSFPNQLAASTWAYATAQSRIAKLTA